MNSYNDNLHSSVVSSLSAQELELQSVEAKLEASMFSLYYAQGARITTAEELEITTAKYAFEKKVHEQAIIDSDISTNVLESTNNAKDYTAKSVTNTSVAAANVQIAANAILKLASDTGAIFSIINAADFDTDIYAQSNKAKVLMDDTAYLAEQASQHSMEASSAIAEVTTTTLASKATVTDTSIKNLLAVVTKQFDDTTALLASQSAALATANTKEKQAEGVLEDYSVSFDATEQAYELSNSELNLDLMVTTPITVGDHDSYIVSFSPYVSAFQEQTSTTPPAPKDTNQPVESYNIMLVKNSSSGTFSMNDAEGILTGDFKDRYVPMSDEDIITVTKDDATMQKIVKKIYTSGSNTTEHTVLKDSDGIDLVEGQEYVIFVFAVFKTAYKKIINTFDDYLSAPSKAFVLQNQLNSAVTDSILEKQATTVDADADGIPDASSEYQIINFDIFENPKYEVAYRCVFLPHNPELVQGLLTVEGVENIENNIQQLTKIEQLYGIEISDINAQITSVKADIKKLEDAISQNEGKIKNAKEGSSQEKKLITQNEENTASIDELKEKLKNLETELTNLTTIRDTAITNLDVNKHIQPGFFFNLTTAEKISAGSYTHATSGGSTLFDYFSKNISKIVEDAEAILALRPTEENSKKSISELALKATPKNDVVSIEAAKNLIVQVKDFRKAVLEGILNEPMDDKMQAAVKQFLQDLNQFLIDLLLIISGYTYKSMQVTLAAETTDNFGNRLIGNNVYIPAVISITNNTDETENTKFINALSDFNNTASFTYKDPYADSKKIVVYPKQTTV